jgi:four helix bundle protein
MAIKDVSDLNVYQRALRLLKYIYRLASLIPEKHRKLRRQLIEAAEAVAPLIAEGFAKKRNEVECKRFFEMAMAESDETITHLREVIIVAKSYLKIKEKTCNALIEEYKIESKQLQTLIKNWNKYPIRR